MKGVLLWLVWLLTLAASSIAQERTTTRRPAEMAPPDTAALQEYRELIAPKLHLLAQSYGDSVVLRWAPSNAPAWRAYNRIGYIVERALVDTTESGPLRYERLTPEPLKPWTLEEWRRRSRPEQQFAAIAVQCLYGALSIPNPNTMQNFIDAASELENRFGFALFAADCDAHTANGLGLRWVDRAVRQGQVWAYRVFPARLDSVFLLDTAYVVVHITPYRPWPPVLELTAEGQDREITLRWKNFPEGGYTGFNVYRSEPGGRRTKLNTMPIVPATPRGWTQRIEPWFNDTTARWGVEYTYEVRGINPFGEEGEPAVVRASLRDRTPPPLPVLKKPILYGMTMVRLEWEIKETPDLKGFFVLKSDKPDQNWRLLHDQPLPRTQRSFLDTLADPDFPHYTVIAIDTANNFSDYLPIYVDIYDTIPPAPPTGVRGTIDTNGVVRLEWNLGTERDLLGYRVLWANDTTHEFTQRTNLVWTDTVFYDTVAINTLTEYVYYRVVAVDNRYFHSDPSPIIALKRPDVVPPVAPVFTDVRVFADRVVLTWNPSTSTDVAKHVLYRRARGDTGWTVRAELPATAQQFTDTAVVERVTYDYTLEAVDRTGLRSERALPVPARPYGTVERPPVESVRAAYDSVRGIVVVQWSYALRPTERYWYVLYRAVDDNPLQMYRTVEPPEQRFVDTELVGRGRYRYAVRVMTANGQSPLSEEQEVEVR
ncbi:MAG: hypothetical protein NZ473_04060 [Candidatus Kapabacteria bacterium]|nr:hypothetical protein [Candidatus Kapabacteria bacterium]MDW8225326.1 hypothetical protein [Bacteroidota bacterium]